MAFKEERSGFNKNLGMLESDLSKLKSSLSEKDLQVSAFSFIVFIHFLVIHSVHFIYFLFYLFFLGVIN